jgi:very-short-patch-repair endonuclease
MTDAERKLWSALRRKQIDGHRFRRQVPIGPYIVDFACFSSRLIVEVDGGQHSVDIERDARRTTWLESQISVSCDSGTMMCSKTSMECC